MDIGITMFATDYAMRPDDLAAACEERGFESIWFPEHTHIPASRLSPWPGGAELPKEYWHTHDLFVALMAAAGATKKIKIGSGICLVIERDPIVLAKEVATVDQLSNGRLLFGIGGGWNAEEMENHGTPFKKRWKVLRERIEAMKEIWANDEAEYHGEFTNFDKIWSYPKPAQKPHPPILLGTFNGGLKRVVKLLRRLGPCWLQSWQCCPTLLKNCRNLPPRLDAPQYPSRFLALLTKKKIWPSIKNSVLSAPCSFCHRPTKTLSCRCLITTQS